MHGSVFTEFRHWVTESQSPAAWSAVLTRTGLADEFRPLEIYPDEQFSAILGAAVEELGRDQAEILFDFGEFIAPALIKMYWGAVRPEWTALDLIEHTDDTIHRIVRLKNPEALPPYLKAERLANDEVLIIYTSPRRLCALAKGISIGVGKFYEERLVIEDSACMYRGDSDCRFTVRSVGKA